jgi:orotate phosphoribosyltransferase-like protein
MPNLTEFQKHLIRQHFGEGIIIRAIANELNVSKNTVLLAKEMYKVFVLVVFEKLGLKENISVSVI